MTRAKRTVLVVVVVCFVGLLGFAWFLNDQLSAPTLSQSQEKNVDDVEAAIAAELPAEYGFSLDTWAGTDEKPTVEPRLNFQRDLASSEIPAVFHEVDEAVAAHIPDDWTVEDAKSSASIDGKKVQIDGTDAEGIRLAVPFIGSIPDAFDASVQARDKELHISLKTDHVGAQRTKEECLSAQRGLEASAPKFKAADQALLITTEFKHCMGGSADFALKSRGATLQKQLEDLQEWTAQLDPTQELQATSYPNNVLVISRPVDASWPGPVIIEGEKLDFDADGNPLPPNDVTP